MHKETLYREKADVPNRDLLVASHLCDISSPDDRDPQIFSSSFLIDTPFDRLKFEVFSNLLSIFHSNERKINDDWRPSN